MAASKKFFIFLFLSLVVTVPAQQIALSEKPQRVSKQGSFYSFARISPDGKYTAVSFADHKGIALLSESGNGPVWLTDGDAAGWNFVWSPDSRSIATRINYWNGQRKQSAIQILSVNGSVIAETGRSPWVSLPFWSALGGKVSFFDESSTSWSDVSFSKEREASVVIKDSAILLRDGAASQYPEFSAISFPGLVLNMAWSPDRQKVAVEVLGMGLYVYDFSDGKQYDLGMGEFPNWLTNDYIVYMYSRSNNSTFSLSDLIARRFDGSEYTNLTADFDEVVLYPSVSSNGIAVFVTNKGEVYRTRISVTP